METKKEKNGLVAFWNVLVGKAEYRWVATTYLGGGLYRWGNRRVYKEGFGIYWLSGNRKRWVRRVCGRKSGGKCK